MPDLKLAAQRAIFGALDVPAVTDLAPVFQHVPDDTQPPVVIIGDMSATPIGGKSGGLDRIEFEILTLVSPSGGGAGREYLTPLMAAVRDQLEGQALPAQAGAELEPPVWESDDDEILDDGVTYLGTQRFSLVAQPA